MGSWLHQEVVLAISALPVHGTEEAGKTAQGVTLSGYEEWEGHRVVLLDLLVPP